MARGTSSTADVLLYFLALFLPPVPVFIKRGCGADLLINIALDFLGWIPGVIRESRHPLYTHTHETSAALHW